MPIPKLVATLALEAASLALQATTRTRGPRLSETQVTTADYGTPLPRFLGVRKFAGQIVWSKDLQIVDKTHKIKGGGKQTTQSALWTAGVAIADCRGATGPIDKVLKIWLDETLAYDATGSGPISHASTLGFDLDQVMRIYTGANDQDIDPAYAAYSEDNHGADAATAFRGTAMLVFDGMPCDNFGNRPPQITVLASTSASAAHPFDTVTTAFTSASAQFAFASGGQWMAISSSTGSLEWWDIATRTKIGTSAGPGGGYFTSSSPGAALDSKGNAYSAGWHSDGTYTSVTAPLGTAVQTKVDGSGIALHVTRVIETDDGAVSALTAYATHSGYLDGSIRIAHTQSARDFCLSVDGSSAVGLFQPTDSSSDFTIEALDDSFSFTVAGSATARSGPTAAFIQPDSADNQYLVISDGYWYAVDAADGTVNDSGAWSGGTPSFRENDPDATSFWTLGSGGFNEYSVTDASLIRSLDKGDWKVNSDGHYAFDPVNDAVWSIEGTGNNAIIRYLDRSAPDDVTLGDIIEAMCIDADLSDRDTSALTQSISGYSWTRGDVKSQMEPLLDIHDVDARPHDFSIEFLPRGGSSGGTLLTADFARNGESPRYTITEAQDTDLPVILRVNFADTGFDQQTNNVLSPLPTDAVDSQRDQTIDLTNYAADPDTAQQLADRYLRRQWIDRESIANSLTARQLALEPGDVMTLSLDGIEQSARLTKMTMVGTRIDCEWKRDEQTAASVNDNTTGPPLDRTVETIQIPAPIQGFVIDAPYRSDDDDDVRPVLFGGAGAYASLTFPVTSIWEETGTGDNAAYDTLLDTITTGATWGMCGSTLGDALPGLWDRGNTLTITLQNGTLTGCTEDDIDGEPTLNLIAVGSNANGWEWLNFTTATLVSGTTYTLSGFKRGRRGTEGQCGSHVAGEQWVLASSLKAEEMGLDEVGGDASFKAQATGRSLDAAPTISIAPFTGASLKPYAPARIVWTTDGTDMTGTIVRRTRVGGAWVGGAAIPLSENSEAYEVEILDGSTVLRTISVTDGNSFTYSGTDIAADGGTVGVAPSCNVYQLSDAVGRGFALAA